MTLFDAICERLQQQDEVSYAALPQVVYDVLWNNESRALTNESLSIIIINTNTGVIKIKCCLNKLSVFQKSSIKGGVLIY